MNASNTSLARLLLSPSMSDSNNAQYRVCVDFLRLKAPGWTEPTVIAPPQLLSGLAEMGT
jgi:hypothetical protein